MYLINIKKIELIDSLEDIHTFPLGFESTGISKYRVMNSLIMYFCENKLDKDIIFFLNINLIGINKFSALDGIYEFTESFIPDEKLGELTNKINGRQQKSDKIVDIF